MDVQGWLTLGALLLAAGTGAGGWITSRANRGLIIANTQKAGVESAIAIIEQLRVERDRYERKWQECVAQREADGKTFAGREEIFNRERLQIWAEKQREAEIRLEELRAETAALANGAKPQA